MNFKSGLIAVLIGSLTFPSPLFSQDRPKVAVINLKVPIELYPRLSMLRTSIVNSFAKHKEVQLISRQQVENFRKSEIGRKKETSSTKQLREGRELLVRGKKLYDKLNFDAAIPALEQARREFILNLHLLRSNRDLIDAHLYLGLSYFAVNRSEPARLEFQKLLSLDPSRELSTQNFSPKVVSFFSSIKQEMNKMESSRVRIEVNEPNASVYINGKLSGVAPLELHLNPGEYFLLVEKEGLPPWYKPIQVKKMVQIVTVTLNESAYSGDEGEFFGVKEGGALQDPEFIDLYSTWGAKLKAQILFLGEIEKGESYKLLGQLFDVRTKEYSKVVSLDLGKSVSSMQGDANDLVDALVSQIRPDTYVTPNQPADLSYNPGDLLVGANPPDPEKQYLVNEKQDWYKKWWVWGIIGVAVIGAGVGISQLAKSNQSGQVVINNRGNF